MQDKLLECYSRLGFSCVPFSITPDTSLFFPGGHHASAYRQLAQTCAQGQLTVMTGEIGLGKTLLVRCLLRQLPEQVKVAYLLNPLLDHRDLLQSIYSEFADVSPDPTLTVSQLNQALVECVIDAALKGVRHVVIVDEAHRLQPESLEMLRLLSNLETERTKLISLILAGQPELEQTLQLRAMRPLRERIGTWVRLQAMDRAESDAYIQHRIRLTHRTGDFRFTPMALWWLYRRARGVPRRINYACEKALLLAYAKGMRQVDWSIARQACGEFSKAWQ